MLIDALLTVEQADALGKWVAAHGKHLTTIYVTHGHSDHFFGLGALLDRLPEARALATPAVVKYMRRQASPESIANFWGARFPGQLPDRLVIAEELEGSVIDLEGRDLVVVEVGHTDTDDTTCMSRPLAWCSLGMSPTTTSISASPSPMRTPVASGSLRSIASRRCTLAR